MLAGAWSRSTVAIIAASVLGWNALIAQSARGRVLSAVDSTPIAGAIVQLRASNGAVARSVLSGTDGSFTSGTLSTGTYAVRVLRIGFQPVEAGVLSVSVESASAPPPTALYYWTASPVTLSAQRTRADRTCRIARDSGSLVLGVWEEARKALLASLLADARGPLEMTRMNISRTLDSTGLMVRRQRSSVEISWSLRAYASLPADTLALEGYVRDDAGGVSFYAPDASALLAESFAASHCFAVRDGNGSRREQFGLAFEPTTIREGKADIRGTFWLDRRTWQLRSLEFAYVGLPRPASVANSGGEVTFAHLVDGSWIISHWSMRLPRLEVRAASSEGGMRRVRMAPTTRVISAIEEASGVVVAARRDGVLLFETPLPSLTVVVSSSPSVSADASATLGGVEVHVDAANLWHAADSTGTARFPALPEGRYRISARYPQLAALGDIAISKELTVRAGSTVDSLRAPTPETVLRSACGASSVRDKQSVIFGVLRDSLARPTPGTVTVTWPAAVQIQGTRTGGDQLSWKEEMRSAQAGTNGAFKLCGVPRQRVPVRAAGASGEDSTFVRTSDESPLARIELRLRPRR